MLDFKQLKIWKLAHELTLEIYHITASFPKAEFFGLINQLRRAASSVGANIAEGCGRRTENDFRLFLHHAQGSIKEVENFILLARDLNYITDSDYNSMAEKVDHLGKMLTNFIKSKGVP